jgi:hypothetical protein
MRAAVAVWRSAPEGRFRPFALRSAEGLEDGSFSADFEKISDFVET